MELRKSRGLLVLAALFLAIPVIGIVGWLRGQRPGIIGAVCVAVLAALGVAVVAYQVRPFRFAIGTDGLTLRRRGLNRLIPWSDIDKVLLKPSVAALSSSDRRPAQLLLVPVEGVDLGVPLTERSPQDNRASLLLLDFNDVRDTPDAVAQALTRFGGDRFVDLRQVVDDRFSVEFSIVLRGYEPAAVDQLIADGRRALLAGEQIQRLAVRARIEAGSLPIGLRGYDRVQVDELLAALSAQLAVFPGDERRPS
jgi:hypothetical protein